MRTNDNGLHAVLTPVSLYGSTKAHQFNAGDIDLLAEFLRQLEDGGTDIGHVGVAKQGRFMPLSRLCRVAYDAMGPQVVTDNLAYPTSRPLSWPLFQLEFITLDSNIYHLFIELQRIVLSLAGNRANDFLAGWDLGPGQFGTQGDEWRWTRRTMHIVRRGEVFVNQGYRHAECERDGSYHATLHFDQVAAVSGFLAAAIGEPRRFAVADAMNVEPVNLRVNHALRKVTA